MASGIARGRIRTMTTATVESRKMAVILQIIGWQGHEALVYRALWHWTFMLWSIDTCQNKVSADQYHVTISRAQVYSSSRSRVFWSWPSTKYWFFDWIAGSCCWKQDKIVRKPVNASPGLKFIRIITYKTQIKILLFPSRVSLRWLNRLKGTKKFV